MGQALKNRLKEDRELRMKFVTQWTSHNGRKYHSKGELRLLNWLKEIHPEHIWKHSHIDWKGEMFEFDIHASDVKDFYIEYNGIIHYKRLYDQQKYEEIIRKDALKEKMMRETNKRFIVIRDDWDWEIQKTEIKKFLED
jgi:hypothetical protein